MDFPGPWSLAEYIIQIDLLPWSSFKSHSARPAARASKRERGASTFQDITKYVVEEIQSQSSPTKVLHHLLKSGCSRRTTEDIAYVTHSAKLIVLLPLLRVTKDSVSLVYLFEFPVSPFLVPGVRSG